MKSKQIPLFQTQQRCSVDCSLKLENLSTSSYLGQKPPEHSFNSLLQTRIIGFIWTATAFSFLALQGALWSVQKSSILYFSFSHSACLCFALSLIISSASAPVYCAAPDFPVKILLLYDPGLYINLSLLFGFSRVLLSPLFHKMHLQCPALLLTQYLCWTSCDFPSVHWFFFWRLSTKHFTSLYFKFHSYNMVIILLTSFVNVFKSTSEALHNR